MWNPVTGNYATYNGISGINGATRYVASGQSFWVKADDPGAVVSINENAKSSGNGNSFIRKAAEDLTKLRLEITSANQAYHDETAIAFSPSAHDGYDRDMDADKFAGGWINISSLVQNDTKDLAINAMGELRGAKSVPLRIRPYYYGTYTIDFNQYEHFDPGAVLKLIDHYTGKSVLVNSNTQYQLDILKDVPETFADGRLEIQFAEPITLALEDQTVAQGKEVMVYLSADKLADVMASNFNIHWNAEALEFIDVEDFGTGAITVNDFDASMTTSGNLGFHWKDEHSEHLDLADGSKLFAIRFLAKDNADDAVVSIDKNTARFTTANNIDLPLTLKSGLVDVLRNSLIAGTVKTPSGVPLDHVAIKLSGSQDEQVVNSKDGQFNLDGFEKDQYDISASGEDNSDILSGISVLDIILARRHLLNVAPLTNPYQLIAADVNGSSSVSTLDIAEIQQVLLGNITSFSGGSPWIFVPSVFDLSVDPFEFKTSYQFTMGSGQYDINFVGVKRGDVDMSWNNGARKGISGDVTFDLSDITREGHDITVPVTVKDFQNISGYQFTITWDPHDLDFTEVQDGDLNNLFNKAIINSGKLTVLWDDARGKSVTLADGSKLLELHFTAKNEEAKSAIEVSSDVTPAIAYDESLNPIGIKSNKGYLKDQFDKPFELQQNTPNPFTDYTDIRFKIPEKGSVTLTVVNLMGELVYRYKADFDAGENVITWNRNKGGRKAVPGVYIYRVESGEYSATKKLVIK